MFSVVSICSVGEVFQILISVTEPEPVSSVGLVLYMPCVDGLFSVVPS